MMRVFLVATCIALLAAACNSSASQNTWQSEGRVEAMDGQTWVVGSQLVTVASDASLDGNPAVGTTVRVSGWRRDNGEMVIDSVEVIVTSPTATAQPPAQTQARTAVPPKPAPAAPAPAKKPAHPKRD